MSRPLAIAGSFLALSLSMGGPLTVFADCVDTPVTINFDSGSGTPHCYTESGLTVCAYQNSAPDGPDDTLMLGDNDGDSSPDLAIHMPSDHYVVYEFSLGGAYFAVTSFDFTRIAADIDADFESSKGYGFDLTDSQFVMPDPEGWSGITSFTMTVDDYNEEAVAAVIDNLAIVIQCCGNGVVDSGEQCDDGNTLGTAEDGNCCTSTCQFEPAGSFCFADYDFCTVDACDGAGACANTPIPNCNLTRACGPVRPPGNDTFEHPKSAKKYQTNLTQAFVSCGNPGGNSPSRTTEGGVPACIAQTFNEQAGSPSNGWRWDEGSGQAVLQMKPICKGADDAEVKMKIIGVVDGAGQPAATDGQVALVLRLTLDDPTGGNMTTVDVTGKVPITMVDGRSALKTSVGVMLTEAGLSDVPNGSSIEIMDVQVLDPNGTLFAHSGIYMP
jgi:cysteine-rich repeat protein